MDTQGRSEMCPLYIVSASLTLLIKSIKPLFAFAAAVVSSRVRGNSSGLHTKARGQAQEELRGHVREISSGAFRLLLATCDLRPATRLIEHRITSFNVGEGDTYIDLPLNMGLHQFVSFISAAGSFFFPPSFDRASRISDLGSRIAPAHPPFVTPF